MNPCSGCLEAAGWILLASGLVKKEGCVKLTVSTPSQIYMLPNDTHMIFFWQYPTALCPIQHQPLQLSYPLGSWKKSISLSACAISTSSFPSCTSVWGKCGWEVQFICEGDAVHEGCMGIVKNSRESFFTSPSGWGSSLCTCSPEQADLASDLQVTEC